MHATDQVLPPADDSLVRLVKIEGIPHSWRPEHVYETFKSFGPIIDIRLSKSETNASKSSVRSAAGLDVDLNMATKSATILFAEAADAAKVLPTPA